jgi:hypothetical protein
MTEQGRKERHTTITNLLLFWWIIVATVNDYHPLHWWQLLSPELAESLRQAIHYH